MPNWCTTELTFTGDDVGKLNDIIAKGTAEENTPSDFGNVWLGNLAINAGVCAQDKFNEYPCRGSITYQDFDGTTLSIDTETAWGPLVQVFRDIIEKNELDVDVEYICIEPGMGIFLTNRDDVGYYADVKITLDNNKEFYFYGQFDDGDYDAKEVLDNLSSYLGVELLDIKDFIKKMKNFDFKDDDYAYVDEFEYCSFEEL